MLSGFTAADFDCYEPRKWRSNVYNRERLEVKQKLLLLAREIAGPLQASDGSLLHIEASVEHPALWNHKLVDCQSVYFSRNEAARKELDRIIDRQKPIASLLDDPTPQRNHVFLAVTLDHEALEVSLKLHPDASVDRQNLERKVADHFESERLIHLLAELPPGFRIGVTPDVRPVADLTQRALNDFQRALRAIVDSLPHGGSAGMGLPALPGQAPVAHLFYVGRALPRAEAQALPPAGLAEWTQTALVQLLPIYHYIAWSRDNDFVSMRQVLDKEKVVKRQRGFAKNDPVRIVRGVLAGSTGVIQEVDAKGHLKVLVGKLSVKVDAADVERPK
jgi:hypothetical protein